MEESRYQSKGLEDAINSTIGFVFYYRLLFVVALSIAIGIIARYVYLNSTDDHHTQNLALVLTGGSIMIGIFYSIINYEQNLLKFKYDKKSLKETLTYNTSCKMHEPEMMRHSMAIKKFYDDNIQIFRENRCAEIENLLKEDTGVRLSFIIMMNYFEAVSVGIEQGIMDERFIKEFFKTIFTNYLTRFGSYIEYIKQTAGQRVFKSFIKVASRWTVEN